MEVVSITHLILFKNLTGQKIIDKIILKYHFCLLKLARNLKNQFSRQIAIKSTRAGVCLKPKVSRTWEGGGVTGDESRKCVCSWPIIPKMAGKKREFGFQCNSAQCKGRAGCIQTPTGGVDEGRGPISPGAGGPEQSNHSSLTLNKIPSHQPPGDGPIEIPLQPPS